MSDVESVSDSKSRIFAALRATPRAKRNERNKGPTGWLALPLATMGMLVRAGVFKLSEVLGPYFNSFGEEVIETTGNLAVSFIYAGALTLLAHRSTWNARLAPLAAVGRMALSNYLFSRSSAQFSL